MFKQSVEECFTAKSSTERQALYAAADLSVSGTGTARQDEMGPQRKVAEKRQQNDLFVGRFSLG